MANLSSASGTGVEDPLHPTSEEYTQDEVLNSESPIVILIGIVV